MIRKAKSKPQRAVAAPVVARHARAQKPSKLRAIWNLAWRGLAVLGTSAVVIAIFVASTISGDIQKGGITLLTSEGKEVAAPTNFDGPINMLLVGSDTRDGVGNGFGTETSKLADVIILLHISADRKNAVAMSFPRDTMVPWPACPAKDGGPGYLPQSLGQINATIANGGPGCTVLTVEKLTGLKIPYLAMINFAGVIEMSNAIGGVEVCVANAINDPYTHTKLSKGKHVLLGRQALQFLRTRHGIGDGSDLARISNQQVFLTSLMRKIKDQGVLSNPVYLYSLASAVSRNMTLSKNLTDVKAMVGLASSLKDIELENMTFLQLPARTGLPAPYSGRVAPLYDQANAVFKLMKEDKPIVLKKANTRPGSTVAGSSPAPSSTTNIKQDDALNGVLGTNAATTTCSS